MGVAVNGYKDAALAELLAGAGLSGTCLVHLYQNAVTPAPTDTLASYVEATYAGYAPATCSPWGGPTGGSGGTSSALGTPAVFAPGVLVATQAVIGYFVTDGTGALIGAGIFTGGPYQMGGTTLSLTVTPSLTLS